MKAAEARNKSLNALANTVNAEQINITNRKIQEATEKGKFDITHPFAVQTLSRESIDMLVRHFENEGYKVKHHPNPDVGHPSSSDYYTLSW